MMVNGWIVKFKTFGISIDSKGRNKNITSKKSSQKLFHMQAKKFSVCQTVRTLCWACDRSKASDLSTIYLW
jgi:hypothetical protein